MRGVTMQGTLFLQLKVSDWALGMRNLSGGSILPLFNVFFQRESELVRTMNFRYWWVILSPNVCFGLSILYCMSCSSLSKTTSINTYQNSTITGVLTLFNEKKSFLYIDLEFVSREWYSQIVWVDGWEIPNQVFFPFLFQFEVWSIPKKVLRLGLRVA